MFVFVHEASDLDKSRSSQSVDSLIFNSVYIERDFFFIIYILDFFLTH